MAFDIPLNIRNVILPPGNLSPHRLIHFRTPTNTLPIISSNNPHVLSRTVSNIVNANSAMVVLAFDVPQPEDLKQLKSIALEGASTGFISLDYPTPQGSMLKIPFWVLTYWEELPRVCKGKDEWRGAIEWLRKEHAYDALRLLEEASWDVYLPMCRGSTTLDLIQFCSTSWLSLRHIDIMGAVVNDKLQQNGTTLMVFGDSLHIDKLITVYRYGREGYLVDKSSAFLRELSEDLKFCNYTHIGFCISVYIDSNEAVLPGPAHEHGNHWTAVVIDALDQQIFYGDPMKFPPPDELIGALRWWLQVHINDNLFRVQELPCAEQQDVFSCSIISINAIAHLFHPNTFPLLQNAHDAMRMRMDYFTGSVELAKRLVRQLWYICKPNIAD